MLFGLYLFWSKYMSDNAFLIYKKCSSESADTSFSHKFLFSPRAKSLKQSRICIRDKIEIQILLLNEFLMRRC